MSEAVIRHNRGKDMEGAEWYSGNHFSQSRTAEIHHVQPYLRGYDKQQINSY